MVVKDKGWARCAGSLCWYEQSHDCRAEHATWTGPKHRPHTVRVRSLLSDLSEYIPAEQGCICALENQAAMNTLLWMPASKPAAVTRTGMQQGVPFGLCGVILGQGLSVLGDGLGGPLESAGGNALIALQGLISCSGPHSSAASPGHRGGAHKGCTLPTQG